MKAADPIDTLKPVRMRRLVGWGVMGQVGYLASQFFVLLALTRLESVYVVGAFGLASAISFPIMWFFNLGMRTNVATDIGANYSFADFLRLRILACLIAYAIVIAIAAGFLEGTPRAILLTFGAAKCVELVSEFGYGVFQRADKMWMVARSQMIRGMCGAAVFVAVLASGLDVVIAFAGMFVVWSLIAFTFDLAVARRIAQSQGSDSLPSWGQVLNLARVSLPLGLNGGLSAIQGNVPRYAIASLVGLVGLGQFTVVSYVMQFIATVFGAVSQSIVSRLATYIANGQRRAFFKVMTKFVTVLALLGFCIAGLSIAVGDQVIVFVFGPDFSDLGLLLALLSVAAVIRSTMLIFQSGLQAGRQFYRIAITRFIFVFIMGAACFLSTWWAGLNGLGVAMIVVYAVQAATLLLFLRNLPFGSKEEVAI